MLLGCACAWRAETEAALERKRRAVENAGLLFAALNYKAVLARGYALVRDNSRAPVALAERARKLATLHDTVFRRRVDGEPRPTEGAQAFESKAG